MFEKTIKTGLPKKFFLPELEAEILAATGQDAQTGDYSLSVRFDDKQKAKAVLIQAETDTHFDAIETAVKAHKPAKSDFERVAEANTKKDVFAAGEDILAKLVDAIEDLQTRVTNLEGG